MTASAPGRRVKKNMSRFQARRSDLSTRCYRPVGLVMVHCDRCRDIHEPGRCRAVLGAELDHITREERP